MGDLRGTVTQRGGDHAAREQAQKAEAEAEKAEVVSVITSGLSSIQHQSKLQGNQRHLSSALASLCP